MTVNFFSVEGPKEVVRATSTASLPRAMTIRPMRGMLWRASKVYQRPSRKTSVQALKSIGSGCERNADVAEIAGGVSGGDIQAAEERDQQMGEIAADALALPVDIVGGFGRAGEFIAELNVVVDPVADGLNAGPAEGGVTEQFPGGITEVVGFAISAGEEEGDDFGR